MTERFADTFVFLAMLSKRDRKHQDAVHWLQQNNEPLVTTHWVLTELADGLCHANTRGVFSKLEQRLLQESRVIVIPATADLYEQASQLYQQRPDKNWSLTDCTSFVVMEQRGIDESLTGDHHFEQAGFIALLK